VGGVAAIASAPGKGWCIAEVLTTATAIGAAATSAPQPRHPHPIANALRGDVASHHIDNADHLVAGNNRVTRLWQFAIDEMKIGATHATSLHPDANLVRPR
jgi:hypothetical protein